MKTLTIRDQAIGGQASNEFFLNYSTDNLTVRELIKNRIVQEVSDYNSRIKLDSTATFNGLVQPSELEKAINAKRPAKLDYVDWREQFDKAIDAFQKNQVFVLVDDKQVENLDDEIAIGENTVICFLKLVPLVGG
jgi:hypothetical protein